jgi:hypothetical protein
VRCGDEAGIGVVHTAHDLREDRRTDAHAHPPPGTPSGPSSW